MNSFKITLLTENIGELPGWGLAVIAALLILWLWSVVVVATEKTEDPFDRIVWLLVVLILNFVGTLLYFFFGPTGISKGDSTLRSEEEIKRRVNKSGP